MRDAWLLACARGPRDLLGLRHWEGPVQLSLVVRHAIPASWPAWKKEAARQGALPCTSKPDESNVRKAIEDALNGLAYVDDKQVVAGDGNRKEWADEPCVEVTLRYPEVVCPLSALSARFRQARAPGRGKKGLRK